MLDEFGLWDGWLDYLGLVGNYVEGYWVFWCGVIGVFCCNEEKGMLMVVIVIDGKVFVVDVWGKVVEYVVWLKEENGIVFGFVVVFVGEDFVS